MNSLVPILLVFIIFSISSSFAVDILEAVESGDIISLNDILNKEPDIINQKTNDNGMSPLIIATSKNNIDIVQTLLIIQMMLLQLCVKV